MKKKGKNRRKSTHGSDKDTPRKPKQPGRQFPGTPSIEGVHKLSSSGMEDLELPSALSSSEQEKEEEELDFWQSEVEAFVSGRKHNIHIDESASEGPRGKLIIHIEPNVENSVQCSIDLRIGHKKGYPCKPPSIRIVKAPNVKGSVIDILQDTVVKQAKLFAGQCAKSPGPKEGLIARIVQIVEAKLDEYALTKNVELSPVSKARQGAGKDLAEYLKSRTENEERQRALQKGTLLNDVMFYSSFAPLHRSSEEESSRYLNDFEELSMLGSGGSGHVYLVKNRTNGQQYAIKKVMLTRDSEYNATVMQEVSLFSRLNHPNIVRYYDAWIENIDRRCASSYKSEEDESYNTKSRLTEIAEEYESSAVVFVRDSNSEESQGSGSGSSYGNNRSSSEEEEKTKKRVPPSKEEPGDATVPILHLQMEYCEGATLASHITACKKVPAEERWKFFRQILEALAYIHGRSLVHRDLKPTNIFLTKEKSVKLGDFGLAVKAHQNKQTKEEVVGTPRKDTDSSAEEEKSSKSRSGNVGCGVGTPFYRSKEQENGENPIDKSDIYSLGIILFELCYPFETLMERALVLTALRNKQEFPREFDTIVEGASEVKKLIIQCLQEQPADRPSSIEILQRNSELLPKRIEDTEFEQFVKIFDDRNTVESHKLMSFLFLEGNDADAEAAKEDSLATAVSGTGARNFKQAVVDRLSKVFHKYSALSIETKAIYPLNNARTIFVRLPGEPITLLDVRKAPPKDAIVPPVARLEPLKEPSGTPPRRAIRYTFDVSTQEEKVILLDHRRVLMQFPYNLHIPWCRFVARTGKFETPVLRRYTFGDVYFYHEHKMHTSYCACFDIVVERETVKTSVEEGAEKKLATQQANERAARQLGQQEIWHEAEVLKVTDEVFGDIYQKGYKFVISSTHLIDYVLGECGVSDLLRTKLYKYLRKGLQKGRHNRFTTIKNLKKALATLFPGVNAEKLLGLMNFQARAPTELEAMISKSPGFKRNHLWDFAYWHLETLFEYCQALNIDSNQMMIDMTLMPDSSLIYHSGLIFNVVYEKQLGKKQAETQVVAVGGRYDNTLHQYLNPLYPKSLFGAGVDIFCEAFAKSVLTRPKEEKEVLLVFEAIFGKSPDVDKECLAVLNDVWRRNCPATAEFYERREVDEWVRYAQANNMRMLMIVKQQLEPGKYIVLIRNFEKNRKEEVKVSPLRRVEDYLFAEEAPSPTMKHNPSSGSQAQA